MKKKIIFLSIILSALGLYWISDKQNGQPRAKSFGKEVPLNIVAPEFVANDLSDIRKFASEQQVIIDKDAPFIDTGEESLMEFEEYSDYDAAVSLADNKVDNTPLLGEFNQKQNEQPLLFLENKGQILDVDGNPRPDILYTAKSNAANVYVTASALHYQFTNIKADSSSQTIKETHRFSIQLENVNPSPLVKTSTPEVYTENYYNEHFPEGLMGVRSFTEIILKDIYPGIDWIIYSKDQFMEYDFIVHPGADPKQIRFKINDADNAWLTEDGDLKIETRLGEVLQHAPISFVEGNVIASRFEAYDNGSYGFDVIAPKDKILRIDPYVEWGTYYGGTGAEVGKSIKIDGSGNIYMVGKTSSSSTIASSGAHDTKLDGNSGNDHDAFLVKFDPNGERLWGTYFGGSGDDIASSVTVSSTGYVYITGTTTSSTAISSNTVPELIPSSTPSAPVNRVRPMVRNTLPSDLAASYIAKFNGNGNRLWSTYLHIKGGASFPTGKGNTSEGIAVGVSPDGQRVYVLTNVYFRYNTTSFTYDIVQKVLSFIPMNTWLSTALTIADMAVGAAGLLPDEATSCAQLFCLDAGNGEYINDRSICSENVSDFPMIGTALAIGDPIDSGNLLYNIYLTGYTNDNKLQENIGGDDYDYTNNPGSNTQSNYSQVVIVKFNSLQFWSGMSTVGTHRFYGGPDAEIPTSIAVDGWGPDVYIAGATKSSSGATANGFDGTYNGGGDGFLAKINMDTGNAYWATYYGGWGEDIINDVQVAQDGNVYIVGTTRSESGIAHNGYMQARGGVPNDEDAFLAKFTSEGNRAWGTYVGGAGIDRGNSVAIRTNNKIYVAGTTSSSNGIGKGNHPTPYKPTYDSDEQQAFLMKYAIPSPDANGILYVKKEGTGDKTGRDWNNAIGELADALQATKSNTSIKQIWVTGGTYKPLHRPDGIISSANDTLNTFLLTKNVKIYGGFAGTEISLAQRNITANETILSGDFNGNDTISIGYGPINYDENSDRIVMADGVSGNTELNGFTIRGARTVGLYLVNSSLKVENVKIELNKGAGISNLDSSPVFNELVVTKNWFTGIINTNSSPLITNAVVSHNLAGGVYNWEGTPVFNNVNITGNTVEDGNGAGMYNASSSPVLTDVTIVGNITKNGNGAGMYNASSSPVLTDVTFAGNITKNGNGGGMYNGASSPVLTNVTISENEAESTVSGDINGNGGGFANYGNSSMQLNNVTISENEAENYGGGVYNVASAPIFDEVTIDGNQAKSGGGIFNRIGSEPVMKNSTISNNEASEHGGGIYNMNNSHAQLDNVAITGNSAGGDGGGICNLIGSNPVISDSRINDNSAYNGGGIYNTSSMSLTQTEIKENTADWIGGGMHNSDNASPVLQDVEISGNIANAPSSGGGGMYNTLSTPLLRNVKITANEAPNASGGGISNNSSNATFINVLIAENKAVTGAGVRNNNSSPIFINTTLARNEASSGVISAMQNVSSSPKTYNSILFGNTGLSFISNDPSSDPEYAHSFVEGSGGSTSWDTSYGVDLGNNISSGVVFADMNNGDYSLLSNSPTVNAGNNTLFPNLDAETIDLLGNPRVYDYTDNGIIDMGAHEFQGNPLEISPDTNGIVYVKKGAMGSGISWNDAAGELADALVAAKTNPDITKIYVSVGTYKPLYSFMDINFGNPDGRNNAFLLMKDVEIFGGFDPDNGVTDLSHNRILPSLQGTVNGSVLSGDIDNNGILDNGNAYHLVVSSEDVGTAVLDGFTISGGNANDPYPSMVQMVNGQPITAGIGGGIVIQGSSPIMRNIAVKGNTAILGGGIYNASSSAILSNIIISENTAVENGGGILNYEYTQTLTNVLIIGNMATDGGGIYNHHSSTTAFVNVTVSNNTASGLGGGVFNFNSTSPAFRNTIIWGNTTEVVNDTSIPVYTNSLIGGSGGSASWNVNFGTDGGNNLDANPLFTDASNYDYSLAAGSPAIDMGNENLIDLESFQEDLSGNQRFVGSFVDIGAFEYQGNHIMRDENNIVYIKPNATGNGSSWSNALGSLSAAVNAIGVEQIWVAEGTYYVTGNGFTMKNNVAVYGGFPATGDPDMDDRDWELYETILSGNNQRRVIYNNFTSEDTLNLSAVLDGFTITGGATGFTGSGGGIYNQNASPYLKNLRIKNNNAGYQGGGMYNVDSSPSLSNVFVESNSSDYRGGGIYNANSSLSLLNVFVENNNADYEGGGIYNESSSLTMNTVTVSNNIRGGIHSVNSFFDLDDGLISNNTILGGIYNENSSPIIANTTIGENSSTLGGGMHNQNNSSPTLTNVIIKGNTAADTGGGIFNSSSSPTLINSVISNNEADNGGSMYNSSSSPVLINVTIVGNIANTGGAMSNVAANPVIHNSIIWGNSTEMSDSSSSNPQYSYSLLQGRTSGANGNIPDTNPFFTDAANGDYSLSLTSPAINRGDNTLLSPNITLDLAGFSRVYDSDYNGKIDLGAYEYQGNPEMLTLYVKQGGTGNGLTWNTAMGDVQQAINTLGVSEVWVAEGTYYSPAGGFRMKNNVSVYGGFPNTVSPIMDDRDWELYETILSGDDLRSVFNNSFTLENPLTQSAVLDGFIITKGNGGAMNNNYSSPTLKNLIIKDNTSTFGGGMSNQNNSSPVLTNVVITENTANTGGGMSNQNNSSPVLTNVMITENTANTGGGMYNQNASSPIMTGVIISKNIPEGMSNRSNSEPFLKNVLISENQMEGIFIDGSSPSLINVAIIGNGKDGLVNQNAFPVLTNVTIAGNTDGGIVNYASSIPVIRNSIIWGNDEGIVPLGDTWYEYSLIQELVDADNGNIPAVDPVFTNAANKDYTLSLHSPTVNTGNNNTYNSAGGNLETDTDLSGAIRIYDYNNGGIIDMGAYEYQGLVCSVPEDLAAVQGANEATLSWSSTGNAFDIEWGGEGFVQGTGTYVYNHTATTYTVTSLTENIIYEFYVRNDCGYGQSLWEGPFPFSSLSCPTGDFDFYTQGDLDDFGTTYAHCTNITLGNVTISGATITDLSSLMNVVEISSLYISDTSLQNIDELAFLKDVTEIEISNNSILEDIDGLNSIETAESILISDNPLLNNIDGLDKITSLWSLNIMSNTQLQHLNGLSALETIGALNISDNTALSNISGLGTLVSIDSTLEISNNQSLVSLQGLNLLETIGENLYINNNAILANLQGLNSLKSIQGRCFITNNASLNSLVGLNALENIEFDFRITGNLTLISVNGLDALETIGDLYIENNPQLENIGGLDTLENVGGAIYIGNNSSLTDISGLENVDFSELGGIEIVSNTNLSLCLMMNLCNYLSNPSTTHPRNISGNASFCIDEAAVVASCAPCDAPTNLSAIPQIATALLSWNSSGNLFDLEWGTAGFIKGAGTLVNGITTISYNLSLPQDNTEYEFYVRQDCNAIQSDWTGPFLFKTLRECPTGDFTFTTQAQIDDFGINYAHCTDITLNNLVINYSSDITDLSGLSNVKIIGGHFEIVSNASLQSLSGLNIESIGSNFHIEGNPVLSYFNGMDNLESVDGSLIVRSNNSLQSFGGLGNLASVGGSITVENNSQLINFNALSNLTDINGGIHIFNNSLLTDISGLANINPLTISTPGVTILFNIALNLCDLPNICSYLSDSNNPRNISGNAGNCLNESAVLLSCAPCEAPTSLSVNNLQPHSAELTWNSDGDLFDVEWGTTGFMHGSGTTVDGITDLFLAISGLSHNTGYEFYVRQDCISKQSDWEGPFSYTTPYGGYVYANGSWTPGDPSGVATSVDDITIVNGDTALTVATSVNNLTVLAGATLEIKSVLQLFGDIVSEGNLIFVSTSSETGELAQVPTTSTITGNATVHRYMKAERSYRMVSPAVTTTTSIRDNWQEGANNTIPGQNIDPNPGFGTHITGSQTGANGFDATGTGNPSMFTVDVANQQFQAVGNTDVGTLTAGQGYLMFVRGDRGIDLNSNGAFGSTVLRATGQLAVGDVSQSFTAPTMPGTDPAFVMFGNPYQSAVDIQSVLQNSTNVNTGQYYVYDPSLGDNGGYVTVVYAMAPNALGGTNTSGSSANRFLQPGQGGQVAALAAGPVSVNFRESDKAPGQITSTNATGSASVWNGMLVGQLYTAANHANGGPVHDSFGMLFDQGHSNALTPEDAVKPFNFGENLGIDHDGAYLSLERRYLPQDGERFPLYATGYGHSDYVLKMDLDGLEGTAFYLVDDFTGTSTLLPQGTTQYPFTVDATDPASVATDRFSIVVGERLDVYGNSWQSGLTLYPNPLGGNTFYINAPGLDGKQLSVRISDLSGRLLFDRELECRANTVAVPFGEGISTGAYMVTIAYNGQSQAYRLIKE